jgi:hypothetical protein
MNNKQIILESGKIIPLSQWQKMHQLPFDKIGKYFSTYEDKLKGNFKLAGFLILVADKYRELKNAPVIINSAFRSQEYQEYLRSKGYRAAKQSPHCEGMAFDVDTVSKQETIENVHLIEKASIITGIPVRIGYKKYLADGNTFIHFDVCPAFYKEGKPFNNKPHSHWWESENRW